MFSTQQHVISLATGNNFSIGIGAGGYSRRINTEDGPTEVWVETFHVECSDKAGHRWIWDDHHFSNVASVKAVLKHLDLGTPGTSDRWVATDPVYGSDAWGPEDEYNLACFEADCYDEPRPRW